jgi:hypothetical protein
MFQEVVPIQRLTAADGPGQGPGQRPGPAGVGHGGDHPARASLARPVHQARSAASRARMAGSR